MEENKCSEDFISLDIIALALSYHVPLPILGIVLCGCVITKIFFSISFVTSFCCNSKH
jgi:hypothetical protein